jgi:cysteinyl-tRNA synthetase
VPYRNQLNFTFDGLKSAASSVDKLRNFRFRLTSTQFSPGSTPQMSQLAQETIDKMKSALDDDLNTAEAQAAMFDMLRKVNTALDAAAADQNNFRQDDVKPLLGALAKFDEIFGVLKDDDQPKMKAILDWARSEGREKEISPELLDIAGSAQLADEQVNQKLAEMEAARKTRNFKASDALRGELTAAGIIVENTKEGVRWRRK